MQESIREEESQPLSEEEGEDLLENQWDDYNAIDVEDVSGRNLISTRKKASTMATMSPIQKRVAWPRKNSGEGSMRRRWGWPTLKTSKLCWNTSRTLTLK